MSRPSFSSVSSRQTEFPSREKLVAGFIRAHADIWRSHAMTDIGGNVVLLNRVKSVCGVGLWFESSRSALYSNTLPSLPSLLAVPCQLFKLGPRLESTGLFFRGCVTHCALCEHNDSPHFSLSFQYFHFCAGIHQKSGEEGKGLTC